MCNQKELNLLKVEALQCQKCDLERSREQVVMGCGDVDASILAVGEGPGRQEDIEGEPFVGAAGKLFDVMLASVGIFRQEIYISNIVKCRPPKNRTPNTSECNACSIYINKEILIIKPKIILCLGAVATKCLYGENSSVTRDRGKGIEKGGIIYLPTFHPAALLRDESKKLDSWNDMQTLQKLAIDMGLLSF